MEDLTNLPPPFTMSVSGNCQINMTDSPVGSPNELSDASGHLFSVYSKMVEEDDNKRAERHQKDAEGIILFTGLFSAALAALITVSVQDLKPGSNSQDNSTFSPPRYAIWVNSLWFASLTISLTSALLATLIQQWTRRYIKITQPLGSPQKRARTRQLFFNGVDNLHFLLATDAVPTLLHLSVFLFFAGLLILLRHINHTVFDAVVAWVAMCVAVYAYITCRPIFWPASPHFTPLSSLVWQFYTNVLFPLSLLRKGIHNMGADRPARLLKRLEREAENIVSKQSLMLDAGILESLLENLGEENTQETFFEAIPGFYNSRKAQMEEFKKCLSPEFASKFRLSVNQFLDRTLSSDSVSELTRSRRLLTCLTITHQVLGDREGTGITNRIIHCGNWNEVHPSPEIGHILIRWRNSTDSWTAVMGKCIIAQIIASVWTRDDTWMALTMSQLGVTKKDLRDYLKRGDSVLLANLINATRMFFKEKLQFQDILLSISEFNVKDTLPELQCNFCTLWNEIVQSMQYNSSGEFVFLQEIWPVYDALHSSDSKDAARDATAPPVSVSTDKVTSPPGSYPSCANPQSHLFTTAVSHNGIVQSAPATDGPSTGQGSGHFIVPDN